VLIAAKETREAVYWMRLADRIGLSSPGGANLMSEGLQLAAILSASARTARSHQN
jgi:hypothetical protein